MYAHIFAYLVLAPKAIPINNWQRLARFCDFFGGSHLNSNIHGIDTAVNNVHNSRPCFVLVKGTRVQKIHSEVEQKLVAACPQHRFIGRSIDCNVKS